MKYTRRAVQFSLISFLVLACIVPISVAQQQSNIVFRDDFTGKSLNPKWRLITPDKDRWTLIDGEYFMAVTTKPGSNGMQFTGDLPQDYEVTIKVETPPQYPGQGVYLDLARGAENNVSVGYYVYPYAGSAASKIFFNKTLKGKESQIEKVDNSIKDKPLYLKLRKHGVEYTGAYSTNGSTWINVGTHVFLNLEGKLVFGGYNWQNAPESGIRFDYVEITRFKQ
jgi:hypothetical protein